EPSRVPVEEEDVRLREVLAQQTYGQRVVETPGEAQEQVLDERRERVAEDEQHENGRAREDQERVRAREPEEIVCPGEHVVRLDHAGVRDEREEREYGGYADDLEQGHDRYGRQQQEELPALVGADELVELLHGLHRAPRLVLGAFDWLEVGVLTPDHERPA